MTSTAPASITSTSSSTLDELATAAVSAAPVLSTASGEQRATWLEAVADRLDANAAELIELADEESHLGTPRLTGELARTTAQLRLFSTVVREGAYLEATIDHADASATPPHADIRRLLRPLGPVAVFAASNFPFAFSVAGGDTASALAVGCPVIVKAHPGHPKLSRLTASLVASALADAGAPAGTFALIEGFEEGLALVVHPAITAVGFTGSVRGGRALYDLAVNRPSPIPFYGELGSINPVVITASAVSERGESLAAGLASSFTMGVGQFCTKPGVVFVPADGAFDSALVAAVGTPGSGAMLTQGMADAFASGISSLAARDDVEVLAAAPASSSSGSGSTTVLRTTAAAVLADPSALLEEHFGPTTLLVSYSSPEEALAAVGAVEGTLTATLHAGSSEEVGPLVSALESIAGRVLFSGWPTGVGVTWSQQHGGPWPSTTSSLFTSVGATAVRRWLRPVAYQDAPERALPDALKESNPLGLPRRVDGVYEVPAVALV
ncbi:aldehyde dehydrogenase (NADP(+)) [Agreia sp. Leaf283]|uniref:aldehyde dehydrogenase (NADP(+)) n=1 Tax=Agreia sp. Leaf283 TaxID=1736321 RepID=UPI0006F2091C|nr:aldehyde dehydrogenase (NADP(+)) [Agreia sp. Leaf283]KQP56857.1 aldehyde dehydrogenase [Agreia sp. Leaf283]